MAHEEQGLTPEEVTDKAWDLAKKIRVCLFTTHDGERHRMRPLSAHIERDRGTVEFLVGADGGHTVERATGKPVPGLVEQIESSPQVSLGFADPGSSDFVAMTGEATVSNDRARIRELWSDFMKAWWDSAEDPKIRLVTFVPDDAELWEGPNKLIAYAVMLTAAATGAKPKLGDHGAVRL